MGLWIKKSFNNSSCGSVEIIFLEKNILRKNIIYMLYATEMKKSLHNLSSGRKPCEYRLFSCKGKSTGIH